MEDHSHHHQSNDPSNENINTNMMQKNSTDSSSMMGMMMQMHGGFKELIVFDTWLTKSIGEFIGSCIALIVIAALYEAIKSLREWLMKHDLNKYPSKFPILRINHLIQTVLHMIQVAISYFLMLVVMTYNSYIFGAIILGTGIGYFLFASKRTTVIDPNEHCS